MTEKVAVVTGGNKGIGLETVKGLCEKFDGVVYLTARNVELGQAAVKELNKLNLKPRFHQLDISDQKSVDTFKDYLAKAHSGLDVLINNAATGLGYHADDDYIPPVQIAEDTISLNYFGTLRVCDALFPLLRENARVINLSSLLGHLSRIHSKELRAKFSDPNLTIPELNNLMKKYVEDVKAGKNKEEGWADSAYEVSKVGISALTVIQQKLFDVERPLRNISVNSCHPGYVDTDMSKHRGVLPVEQGAKASLYLALEAPQSLKGKYVWYDTSIADWYSDELPTP